VALPPREYRKMTGAHLDKVGGMPETSEMDEEIAPGDCPWVRDPIRSGDRRRQTGAARPGDVRA
jgi:hypothetical protein